MIADHDIARWRLRSQQLVRPHAAAVTEVVGNLLAVQAENPRQSEWAVAARTRRPSEDAVRRAIADGRVIRTHVLRPTWHYALAEDIGWLLDLTAPRIRPLIAKQLSDAYGLSDRQLAKAGSVVTELLAERRHCPRTQVAQSLRDNGFDAPGHFVMLLLARLELARVVCSGAPLDGEHTYALFAERVPNPRRLERADALAELALRYFTGHGPATERDLSYWATLTLGDVRLGLRCVRDRLDCFEHDGRTYWHAPGEPPRSAAPPAGHLLQVLDEVYRGYQDSRWVLDSAGAVPRTRLSAIGMGLVDARLVAGMRRTVAGERVTFLLQPYRRLDEAEVNALEQSARAYGEYLGRGAEIVVGEPAATPPRQGPPRR